MTGMPDTIRQRRLDDHDVLHTADVPDSQLQSWLTLIRQWRPDAGLEAGQQLSGSQVYRLDSPLGPITIKHKHYHGFKGLLSRVGLRRTPQLRSFRLGCLARQRGLHTPTPLACIERATTTGVRSFLITRYIEADRPWQMLDAGETTVDTMLSVIGREVADWHLNGFRNRDLKGPNLLYDSTQQILYIIDLDGTHKGHSLPGLNIRGRDLARLKVGATAAGLGEDGWQKLLDAYLQTYPDHGTVAPKREPLVRIVDGRVERKISRYQRQHRPIA